MSLLMLFGKLASALRMDSEVWLSIFIGAVVTFAIGFIIYWIQKREGVKHKLEHDAKLEEIKSLHLQDSEKIKVLFELIVQSQRGTVGEMESADLEERIEAAAEQITEQDSDKAQALKAIAEKDKPEADALLDKLAKYEHDLEELYNLHALNEHRHGNYNESVGWLQKLVELKPDNNEYRQRLFYDNNNAGHFEFAEKLASDTIKDLQANPDSDPKMLVQWLYSLGAVKTRRWNHIDGEKYYDQALELGIKTYGPEHPEIYNIYNDLGIVYMRQNLFDKAEEFLRIAQRIKRVEDDDDIVSKAYITFNLASIKLALAQHEEALKEYEEGKQLIISRLGEDHPALTYYYLNAGHIHYRERNLEKAKQFMQRAIDIFKKRNMTSSPDYTYPLNTMGHVLFRMEEYAEAEKYYLESLDVLEKNLPDGYDMICRVRQYLAENCLEWGKPDRAEHYLLLNISDLEKTPEADPADLEKTHRLIADVLAKLNRNSEAEAHLHKADELKAKMEQKQ